MRLNGKIIILVTSAFATATASANSIVTKVCHVASADQGAVRESNCKGAKDTFRAKQANTYSAAVWSGVGAICAPACANKFSAPTCNIAHMGGTAAENVLEKNFVNGLSPIADKATDKLAKTGDAAPQVADATPTEAGGVNGGACKSAAKSLFDAIKQFRSAGKNGERLQTFKKNGEQLDEQPEQKLVKFNAPTNDQDGSNWKAATSGTILPDAPRCESESMNSAAAAIACAMKLNPNLPPELGTQQFIKDLEKATGKSADQFFADFKDPASAILGSVGGSLTPEQQQAFANSARDMNRYAAANIGSGEAFAMTTGGRRGADSGEVSDELDVNALVGQMLGQLGEGEADQSSALGVDVAAFNRARRTPSGDVSPEDRNFSIFDRVKLRYYSVSRKQHLGDRK